MPCDYASSFPVIKTYLEDILRLEYLRDLKPDQLNELFDRCTWKSESAAKGSDQERKDKTNLLAWILRKMPELRNPSLNMPTKALIDGSISLRSSRPSMPASSSAGHRATSAQPQLPTRIKQDPEGLQYTNYSSFSGYPTMPPRAHSEAVPGMPRHFQTEAGQKQLPSFLGFTPTDQTIGGQEDLLGFPTLTPRINTNGPTGELHLFRPSYMPQAVMQAGTSSQQPEDVVMQNGSADTPQANMEAGPSSRRAHSVIDQEHAPPTPSLPARQAKTSALASLISYSDDSSSESEADFSPCVQKNTNKSSSHLDDSPKYFHRSSKGALTGHLESFTETKQATHDLAQVVNQPADRQKDKYEDKIRAGDETPTEDPSPADVFAAMLAEPLATIVESCKAGDFDRALITNAEISGMIARLRNLDV